MEQTKLMCWDEIWILYKDGSLGCLASSENYLIGGRALGPWSTAKRKVEGKDPWSSAGAIL